MSGSEQRRPYGVVGAVLVFFLIAGTVTAALRHNALYLLLFVIVGGLAVAGVAAERSSSSPRRRRAVRIITLWCFALLFAWLMAAKAVNFQLPQVVFDFASLAVSGALIQLVIARLVAPLFFGNAFCSRACWNGAVFELMHRPAGKAPRALYFVRYGYLALALLLPLVLLHTGFTTHGSEHVRRLWILSENGVIFAVALVLLPWWGSRAYCRYLCPFLSISRWLAPLSLLKVAGRADECTECEACEEQCPMAVPILDYIRDHKRVAARDCILCGRCVETCPSDALALTFRRITAASCASRRS